MDIITVLFLISLRFKVTGVKIRDAFQVVETFVGEENVLLPCKYETESSDSSIVWWYQGNVAQDVRLVGINTAGKMTAMGRFKDRVTRRGKASILLDRPVVADTGNYTCSVTITADIPNIADAVVFLKVNLPNCFEPDFNGLVIIAVLDSLVVVVFVIYQLLYSYRRPARRQLKGLKLLRLTADVITPLASFSSLVLTGVLLGKPCAFSKTGGSAAYITGVLLGVVSLLAAMFTLCVHYQHALQFEGGTHGLSVPVSMSLESTLLEETQESEGDGTRFPKRPVYEVEHRLQRQTEYLLSTPVKYHQAFVQTRCSKNAMEMLAVERSVLVTGNPGDGKTALGIHLLRQCRQDGCRVYIIDSPRDWRRCWEPGAKQAFLIDDCLGGQGLNLKMAEEWYRVQDMLRVASTDSRNIFVSSNVVFRSFCEQFCCNDNESIFGQSFNMRSKENLFSDAEKREIFLGVCDLAGVRLTDDAVSAVIGLGGCVVGFPGCCQSFVRSGRVNPVEYFQLPRRLQDELKILQNSTDHNLRAVYALLYLVALHDGRLSADFLQSSDEDDEISKSFTNALKLCDLSERNPSHVLKKAKRLSVGLILSVDPERDSLFFTHKSSLQATRSLIDQQ